MGACIKAARRENDERMSGHQANQAGTHKPIATINRRTVASTRMDAHEASSDELVHQCKHPFIHQKTHSSRDGRALLLMDGFVVVAGLLARQLLGCCVFNHLRQLGGSVRFPSRQLQHLSAGR